VHNETDPRGTDTELPAFAQARWSFPARARSVSDARHVVRTWAADHVTDQDTQDALAICVSEAVTNAVVHAYRDRPHPGTLELEAMLRDRALDITVRDNGAGFVPRIDSPGLGLGMPLMARLADHVEVDSPADGGTEITLRFAIST
jgi:anti-sigma regulatory factor (Ser/Thr protein kinase)